MTAGEAILEGCWYYWTAADDTGRNLALDMIRVVTDWQEEQAMLKTVGADGAA